jgi:hypothetical protein
MKSKSKHVGRAIAVGAVTCALSILATHYYPNCYLSQVLSPANLPNIGLLIGGVLGIGVAIETLNVLRDQTDATRIAAVATKDSVEMMIRKERARVKIAIQKIHPQSTELGSQGTFCTLENYGATTGFVEKCSARLVLLPEENIAPDYAKCRTIFSGESVKPDSQPDKSAFVTLDPDMLSEEQVTSIRKSELFVHFYGIVRYRDLFDRRWRSTVHLRWTMRWGGTTEGMIMAWWEPVGTAEENADVEDGDSDEGLTTGVRK